MKPGKYRPLWMSFLIGISAFFIIFSLWRVGVFQSRELEAYDYFVLWRSDPKAVDPRIVIVSFDENDIHKYDYPLRDVILAELLEKIERGHPCAIGLDLYRDLPEPRDGSGLNQLKAVMLQNQNIICIFKFGDEKQPFQIPPPAFLADSPDRYAFNDFADYQTIRRGFISLSISGKYQFQSLAFMLIQWYLGTRATPILAETTPDGLATKLGKAIFKPFNGNDGGYVNAPDEGCQFLIDYRGAQNFSPSTVSVDQALHSTPTGIFTDKIVLIGVAGASANDVRSTPVTKLEPGMLIHAQIINQFLRAALDGDQPTTSWGLPAEVAWIFCWCMGATALGYFCHSYWAFGAAFVGALAALFLICFLAFLHGTWLLLATPGAAIVLAAVSVKAFVAQMETRQRAQLMQLFSQQVSGEVAKSIWDRRQEFVDGNRPRSQQLMVTVVFTDLKDFSAISEKLGPDALMVWINEYWGAIGGFVEQNGGMINKFMGDAIMAMFGAPIPSKTEEAIRRDAINAVRCALEMRHELQRLNEKWKSRGQLQAEMRIGIYTGLVRAGFVGLARRMEYTTLGDTTNTAARLESVDKDNTDPADGPCRILVGGSTYGYVKDCFETKPMGSIKLKGQQKTTDVYRIVGVVESTAPKPKDP